MVKGGISKYKMSWIDNKGCVVHGALAFILRVSRYCGLAPLNFQPQGSGWYITISPPICFYGYIFATVLSIITLTGLMIDLTVETEKSVRVSTSMTATVFISEVILINITTWLGVFGAPVRIKQMIKIKEIISKINLHKDSKVLSEKKLTAIVVLLLLICTLILGSDYYTNFQRTIEYNKDNRVLYMYIAFFIQYGLVFLLQFQFTLIALTIYLSIKAMNDRFENVFQYMSIKEIKENQLQTFKRTSSLKPSPMYESLESVLFKNYFLGDIKKSVFGAAHTSEEPHEAVHRLASLHCLLCDVVQMLNNSYGLILVALLLLFLVHLVMSPYYLILQIQTSRKNYYRIIQQLLWCLFHTFNMFVIVEPCHSSMTEFDRTRQLVSRLTRKLNSNSCQLAVQLELLSRQLMLRSVHYSPLGMCTMERRLITSIIGGVTTYLVILIQFQKISDFQTGIA